MKKKKRRGLAWALSALLGFVCALVLGALFYATMVYQLGERDDAPLAPQATAAPLDLTQEAAALFPGPLLALPGEMKEESIRDEMRAGERCRVVTRTYLVEDTQVTAISAVPAAYLEMLAQEAFSPELITGFTLAGLDAVLEKKDDVRMLVSREGDRVYFLYANADDQVLYTLGAQAVLQ